MKKEKVKEEFDWYDEYSERDYKLEQLIHDSRQNFESTTKWLYLGADIIDPYFAKIGITTGDLASRSYSSARPTFYLFCAFKFDYRVSVEEIKRVENDLLHRLDEYYCDEYGRSKRLTHYESGKLSECYYPVDFFKFYQDVHHVIYTHHSNSFVIAGLYNDFDVCEGEFVECIFNPRVDNINNKYVNMILE